MALNDIRVTTFSDFKIGAACARQLVHPGVNLALTYSTNMASLNKIVADTRSKNVTQSLRISIHQVDGGYSDQIEFISQQIDLEHGQRPDILISNARYGKRILDVSDISVEEFDYTMNINLRATFILVKGVVEHMKAQRWGRIIFMSSIAAQGGGINGCPSKGGLTGMMKNLSTRLAEYNISVNDVAPAMIGDTGMLSSAAVFPEVAASIPLKRLGIPAEKQRMLLPCWSRLGT
ncbi:Glucose/ribitol dehydrogenase [Penicillium soppii]|uniref:Glucose/ribitol dehydrogenase n=1 Tax=Penicillium soppii TaxID=69789 RepID=UPI0025485D08|nr:Glucose/ribitol dehydrogenase [Penicillium soppii]KAJ5876356.1 Glucose/ribitol dehydrogenase [Penicillium soppii]